MKKVHIRLFDDLTNYLTSHKERLPEGVDLDLMKISTDDNIIADPNGKTEVTNYPVDFRGDLGNPLISAYYNLVFDNLQLIDATLLDDTLAF